MGEYEITHRPKGSMCMACKGILSDIVCPDPGKFKSMTPIGKDKDGTVVVKCENFEKNKVVFMENQHRKIKGYRELSQDEIDLMNEIKCKGEEIGDLINKLKASHVASGGHAIDPVWVSDGELQLKKGIMSLVRSVAQPDSF